MVTAPNTNPSAPVITVHGLNSFLAGQWQMPNKMVVGTRPSEGCIAPRNNISSPNPDSRARISASFGVTGPRTSENQSVRAWDQAKRSSQMRDPNTTASPSRAPRTVQTTTEKNEGARSIQKRG